jgi:hypothetical protein
MSAISTLAAKLAPRERRRTVRLVRPSVQLKLGLYLLAITGCFGAVAIWNTWSAFGVMYKAALSTAAAPFELEFVRQFQGYFKTSLALLGGYVFVVLVMTTAYVHRLVGPLVAIERHLRALNHGNTHSRLSLRRGDGLYVDLAQQLDLLTAKLGRSTEGPAGPTARS